MNSLARYGDSDDDDDDDDDTEEHKVVGNASFYGGDEECMSSKLPTEEGIVRGPACAVGSSVDGGVEKSVGEVFEKGEKAMYMGKEECVILEKHMVSIEQQIGNERSHYPTCPHFNAILFSWL